jgi:hypothetical protein
MRRTIYLGKLPRLERQVRVVLDSTLDPLFSKDFVHSTEFTMATSMAPK